MQKGYFAAAWGDLINSPSWFSLLIRLSLLCFVPVFGVMVVYGYFYGWARDIAWGVHRPLNKRIFANEDNSLYKRGFFILLIGFVFGLAPGVFSCLSSFVISGSAQTASYIALGIGMLYAALFTVLGLFLAFLVQFFVYVGSMRTALYGTLSAGFQISKIWAMIRYDFVGLLRIFAMELVLRLVSTGFISLLVILLAIPLGVVAAIFGGAYNASPELLFGMLVFVVLLLWIYFFMFVFIQALVTRALGYWTRQFDVALWQGQDDPMPFEQRRGLYS